MIQVILIIVVYIAAPLAILTWAWKRFRHGVRPTGLELVVVGLAVVLLALFMFAYSWNVTDRDINDSEVLTAQLVERYSFPKSRYEDRPALRAQALARHIELRVYGITDKAAQDDVLALVKKLRRQVLSKPVLLRFYGEEAWEEGGDGSHRRRPDQEVVLREVRVE